VRNKILELLKESQGEFVSGESISETLHITRAAVWKQIQSLKEAGYTIEGQTKKGYRLVAMPWELDEWALEQGLKTKALGRKLFLYEEHPSTNEGIKELVGQGHEHGTVLIAKRQTKGRGRLRRGWESPAGGLWLSVLLKPKLSLSEAAKLTLSAGVAVAKTLRELYNLEAGIKWPNDIVVKGQKIAGILGEVAGEWNTVQTLVLGIGINTNFSRQALSAELQATTLQELLGRKVNLNQLAAELLLNLEREFEALESGDSTGLVQRWTSLAIGIGRIVQVERAGQIYQGIFRGIRESGELVLESEGEELVFSSGEVSLRAQGQYSPD